ncbi:MAG: DinB family protein [Acidimicrobiaceae bacterium]|nr:DinB family protein [Acidimicrobiaceae bacterium]
MADQRPPHLAADELTTVHDLLQFQRESLVRKVDGVSENDARQSPVQSGTSLLWLMNHIARAERGWIIRRFAGLEDSEPDVAIGTADTLPAAVEFYRQTWREVDDIVARAPGLDERARRMESDRPPVNLRWILMHLLEETARHAGHADILRELLDGSTGR